MYDLKYKPLKPEAVLLNSGALGTSTHQPPSWTLKARAGLYFPSAPGDIQAGGLQPKPCRKQGSPGCSGPCPFCAAEGPTAPQRPCSSTATTAL